MNIISGKIFIQCPGNRGRLRLRDQVSLQFYTFSNFHDANIVAVKTNIGSDLRVLDLQFQDVPVSLQEYLSEIERAQKIRPAKRRGTESGHCYWSISSPYLTHKTQSF
jgi:hypothetical protein